MLLDFLVTKQKSCKPVIYNNRDFPAEYKPLPNILTKVVITFTNCLHLKEGRDKCDVDTEGEIVG